MGFLAFLMSALMLRALLGSLRCLDCRSGESDKTSSASCWPDEIKEQQQNIGVLFCVALEKILETTATHNRLYIAVDYDHDPLVIVVCSEKIKQGKSIGVFPVMQMIIKPPIFHLVNFSKIGDDCQPELWSASDYMELLSIAKDQLIEFIAFHIMPETDLLENYFKGPS